MDTAVMAGASGAGEVPLAGVIGGLGPEATIELMRRVLALAPANDDQDHVPLVVYSNPRVPSRTKAVLAAGESPLPALVEMAQRLERFGASFLVMPCNSAHLYHQEIAASVRIPLLDMLALVNERCAGNATLGLLATTNTVRVGLYHRALAPTRLLAPDDAGQERVMDAIMGVKGSRDRLGLAEACLLEAGRLVERGAEAIVYGCTELSVLLADHVLPVPVLDPLEMLAERIVHVAEPVTTSKRAAERRLRGRDAGDHCGRDDRQEIRL